MNCDPEILQRYMNDVSRYPLLSPEREKELSEIIQKSVDQKACLDARNELITANLLLVINIAVKIYNKSSFLRNSNLSIIDLIQFGNMALIKCASGFKTEEGFKFTTYAHPAIERSIYRSINECRLIRLPLQHEIISSKIYELQNKYGDKLTDEIIMKELKITSNMLINVKNNQESRAVAINDWELFLDRVENKSNKPLMQDLEEKELKDFLLEKIDSLKPYEIKTVYLMYFDKRNVTMADVAKRMGVSRERVRVVLGKALKKLKVKILQEKTKVWWG